MKRIVKDDPRPGYSARANNILAMVFWVQEDHDLNEDEESVALFRETGVLSGKLLDCMLKDDKEMVEECTDIIEP